MATFNHFIGAVFAPLPIGLIALAIGLLGVKFSGRDFLKRLSRWCLVVSFLWLWLFSSGIMPMLLGRSLENGYPYIKAEDFPCADAIVLLGGGMAVNTNENYHAEMSGSADRVWRAAELYRAGKAPCVISTGGLVEQSTGKLLCDMGVPQDKVIFNHEPKNTEEEGRFIASCLGGRETGEGRKKILLVTSAWHMRRAELVFRKALGDDVEIIPAACDYEAITRFGVKGWIHVADLWPTSDNLGLSTAFFKEHYAYWAYKILRGF